MGSVDRMNDLLALQDVPRWGIVRIGRPQSVAEHSFNVTVIADELADRLVAIGAVRIGNNGALMDWALIHDTAEAWTGDIPGNMKALIGAGLTSAEFELCPWIYTPHPPVKAVVKMADHLESVAYLWCWKMGSHAEWVWRSMYHKMIGFVPELATAIGVDEAQVRRVVVNLYSEISDQVGRTGRFK